MTGTLAAGTWLAARFARELPLATADVPPAVRRGPVGPGDFIDVTIEGNGDGEAHSRRVLVLFH